MNFSKAIKPTFLLALGLHAALLFAPTSGESKADSTDSKEPGVSTSELAGKAAPSANALPVPDPKAPAATSASANAALLAAKPGVVNSPAATAAVIRPAPVVPFFPARQPIAPVAPSRFAFPSRPPVPVPSSSAVQPAANQVAANLPQSSSNSQNTRSNQSSSGLPILAPSVSSPVSPTPVARAIESPPAIQGSVPVTNANSEPPSAAADLIASASGKVPTSLRSLFTLLTEGTIYSAEGTDDLSASQKLADWTAAIGNQVNDLGLDDAVLTPVSDAMQVSYPIASAEKAGRSLSLCLESPPHNAEVGLLFNAQGELVGQPEIIRSTGYKALNAEMVAMLANAENFPPARASKAYLYEIEIDYQKDACVSLESLKED